MKADSKIITYILIQSFVIFNLQAQNSIDLSSIQKENSVVASTWHQLRQIDSVMISYKFVECETISYILLKVDNTSGKDVKVTWNYQLINNGTALDINPDDSKVDFNIEAGQSVKGDCDRRHKNAMIVLVSESEHLQRLTSINLLNIKVSFIN